MRVKDLDIQGFDEKQIFNVLHDIYAEIRVKDMMNINSGKLSFLFFRFLFARKYE